jgi:hypothetical protein
MTSVSVKWFAASSVLLCGMIALAHIPPATSQAGPVTAPATAEALPSAKEVIDRYIEVTGGREAYAGITSRHLEADYKMSDLGVTGKLVLDLRADGSARQTIVVPNLDTFSEGVQGDVVWSSSQTVGPRILSGVEAQALRQSLALAPEWTLDGYAVAEVTGISELNGIPCYQMVLRHRGSESTETRYYDTRSGYLVRRDSTVHTSEGPISIITRFGDYEDAPPIRMPMKVRQSMGGLSPEQVVSRVRHNEPIPDEVFALPSDVVELLAHRAATQKSQ